jgi:predicted nicotinamide N-methyase
MDGARAFVLANTAIAYPPLVPEIPLHLATEITPVWRATEAWLERENVEPPFWAFAWPGSQALARLVLDEPARVAGRRVLDFAAGCGLAAHAAARAASVLALEGDLIGRRNRWDTVLAGDVCYEAPMTRHILPWLRSLAAAGAEVLLADPGRAYVPREGLEAIGRRYTVPTTRELEDRDMREVTIHRLLPGRA